MLKGFRNFLMQGDVVILAVGLMIALALHTLIEAFATSIIDPLIARAQGSHAVGLGVQLGASGNNNTFLNFGTLISAAVYFVIFMAVLYFFIVVPYRRISARRGSVVFSDPPPVKTCPACLSDDLPLAATKCKYCGTELSTSPDA